MPGGDPSRYRENSWGLELNALGSCRDFDFGRILLLRLSDSQTPILWTPPSFSISPLGGCGSRGSLGSARQGLQRSEYETQAHQILLVIKSMMGDSRKLHSGASAFYVLVVAPRVERGWRVIRIFCCDLDMIVICSVFLSMIEGSLH